MNPIIKKILLDIHTDRMQTLTDLENDIKIAKEILSGKYSYCSKCDDFYLSKSFIPETEEKEEKVCTYVDPINSGGNVYAMKKVTYHYLTCPKGHRELMRTTY